MLNMSDRLDLLLLGATGFTGKRCVPYINKFCQSDGYNLTWGVAGRSRSKLEQVLRNVGNEIGTDLQKIPIFVVDVNDQKSLDKIAREAKVVINCCGPFRFLGEPVVKACIAAGTDHVDISAEPQFMEKLELELNDAAREKGVYAVTACGFDCVPSDLGVVFLQKQFKGTLNSIQTYLQTWTEEDGHNKSMIGYNSSSIINVGTWESLVHAVANWKEIVQNHKKLFPESMSKYQPEVKQKYVPHRSKVVEGWCVPLPTADASSIKRTQKYLFEVERKRPTQINTYYVVKSFTEVFVIILFALMFYPLTRFKWGRSLLLRYPGIFSLGMFRKEPPTETTIRNTCYQVLLYGEGWDDRVGPGDYQYHKPCDKCILGRVSGRNGYEVICIGVILSAITIITEKEKLPKGGGVFSAGACFAKTTLIDQLVKQRVEFEVIYQKKIVESPE
ncbi:saccharopine dehydrogenase-like oxidoreductase [Anoplophora glabripennis]|uniref:saccharopine dehydrogenase-like oxidoreductase n=1 Tax=Anoplophora glabripennis TaxID=217634 RepID=UPI000874423C|nr:saccharopine dehydrogenase-like oxidoreductase [Anoplophora glabripennis]